jgi:hypothetical protein
MFDDQPLHLRQLYRRRLIGYPVGVLLTLTAAVLMFGVVREHHGGPWSASGAAFMVLCVLGTLVPAIIESER